jgi:hypothetical protein
MHGREQKCIQAFDGETLKEIDHLGDLGVDGRIILKWSLKNRQV